MTLCFLPRYKQLNGQVSYRLFQNYVELKEGLYWREEYINFDYMSSHERHLQIYNGATYFKLLVFWYMYAFKRIHIEGTAYAGIQIYR